MMRHCVRLTAIGLSVVCLLPEASASVISSFSDRTFQTNGGGFDALPQATNDLSKAGTTGWFLSGSNNVVGENTSPATSPSQNFVNLSATVSDIHEPFRIKVGISGLPVQDYAFEYFFTVTVKHEVNDGGQRFHPIGPVTFALVADTIDPQTENITFDITNGTAGDQLPLPTSTYNSVINPNDSNVWSGQSLTFGGLSGGGGEFYYGDTETFTFSMDIPEGAPTGTFFLQMTPNPEPASFFLASLGMVGGGFLYRRRQKKSAAPTEDETPA